MLSDWQTAIVRAYLAWRHSWLRRSTLGVGLSAVLLYEVARALYRPFIRSHAIDDFHVADTLGNSLGTVATVFVFVSLIGRNFQAGIFVLRTVTISVLVYEFAHPLLGKSIDPWDLLATLLAGAFCEVLYRRLHASVEHPF